MIVFPSRFSLYSLWLLTNNRLRYIHVCRIADPIYKCIVSNIHTVPSLRICMYMPIVD